ncbi:MAG TPA: hypothetical protein VK752_05320 [Bryobacteraceae bacterium]|jgi:hypothetical protein|nr:hypothetical protein [Bryobacteraceae bacterium]
MTLEINFRPLSKWTRVPALGYERSQFKMAYNRTLDLLITELVKLDAREVLIEAGFPREKIRVDGWPFQGATPTHPGVVLYFKTAEGAMEFPCGTYGRFEENIHAIALTLENLRAIDRYGVTLGHQQYAGFLALPPAPKEWTVEQAAEFISKVEVSGAFAGDPGLMIANADAYRRAYRKAASKLYPHTPDKNDGWHQLSLARAILDKHHGLKTGGAEGQ